MREPRVSLLFLLLFQYILLFDLYDATEGMYSVFEVDIKTGRIDDMTNDGTIIKNYLN